LLAAYGTSARVEPENRDATHFVSNLLNLDDPDWTIEFDERPDRGKLDRRGELTSTVHPRAARREAVV